MRYLKENFYPENFILLGSAGRLKEQAEDIVSEAVECFPERFEGLEPCFEFEMRYTPPFEKNFHELKRLQCIAAKTAGRRDEFRGYIVIDLSSYVAHEKEPYLEVTLRFLSDMSDWWKYIFLVDDSNAKASKELVRTMLGILLCDIPCDVIENREISTACEIVDHICVAQDVTCTRPVKEFLQEVLSVEKVSGDILSALLRDVSAYFGSQVNLRTLEEYFSKKESLIKYMLERKQYEQFMDAFEHKREGSDEEK